MKALRCALKVAWDHIMQRQDLHQAPSDQTELKTQLQHHIILGLGAQ